MALDVHIVSHTHWDREWYHPFERFRQRLVALIDELLDDPPVDGSFLLDGQAVLIDDYASVRPERVELLASLLRDGRVEAGPWYVLADELIPSGEAIVRNLLAGKRTLARIGAQSPPVLYCPDSFGHPAALPDIACGFGLPLVILWRGYGGSSAPAGDTVRWVGVNGDAALVYHLPRDGYEFGSHLPVAADAARERWSRMRAELAPRSATGVVLIPNGADHHARQRRSGDAIAALERAASEDDARASTLRRFAGHLAERAGGSELPALRGELRDSYGYTWTLQGTFATRAHEKRLNARAERMLVRDTEPWIALASRARAGGDQRDADRRRALVNAAWRDVLMAHPHDTLCGCSIDAVASAMELRLSAAITQAAGLRDDTIAELLGHDPVEARERRAEWKPIAIIRNSAPSRRSGVAIVDVEQFLADVAVGPGSAPSANAEMPAPERPSIPSLGALQLLSTETRFSRTESPRHYPDNDLVAVHRVAAWIAEAPPYGIETHEIGKGAARQGRPAQRVTVDRTSMSNAVMRVEVDSSGVVSLELPGSGRRLEDLLALIDETDVGDLYAPAPRSRDSAIQYRGARVVHRGPLRGEIALSYRVIGPDSRRADANIVIHLILDADAPFLRMRVVGDNSGEDRRLRLALRSDVVSPKVYADAAFATVERKPIIASEAARAVETPPPTAPLHRYVSLFDDAKGVTLFSDGLAEYESRGSALIVTLVRAVGQLSRNDLPERPGHAGWPSPTPLAQCKGPLEAELAVMAHGARSVSTIDDIERTADDVLLPLVGTTLRSSLDGAKTISGVELIGHGLTLSALKESESGEWIVMRCVNKTDESVQGTWRMPFDVREARLARLDETPLGDIELNARAIPFEAPGGAIVTILAR